MSRIAALRLSAWALLAVALSTTACTARVQINAAGAVPPDVSGLLRAGGGSLAIAGIPAGSALVPTGVVGSVGTNPSPPARGPAYQVVVRAWSAADSTGAGARAASVQDVALGDGGSALADVALR